MKNKPQVGKFDPGSVAAGGSVVVVKRSTDPVRINNSSFSVETAGIAAGAYRLVSDKTKFHLNNMTSLAASLPSGSSGNIEIYGYTPSSSMFDAELSLETVEGETLCTTNITVLWVDISMRCGQDDPFSADNGMAAYPASISGSKLGKQRHYGFILPSRPFNSPSGYGNIVELIGTVHPSDFTNSVILVRDSNDFPWHSRTTTRRILIDDFPDFEFYSRPDLASDNECGTGRTSIQP